MRVITSYQLVQASNRSVYSEYMRYYYQQGEKDFPRKMFRRDLITRMKEWIAQGYCLILLLEANKDTNNENLAWSIGLEPKTKMKDLFRKKARKDVSSTWFCSTKQIDGAFSTPYVDCWGARLISFWSGMGYHKAVVVDIPHQYLLGDQVLKVVHSEARRLQCGLTGPKRPYFQKSETLFQ